MAYFRCIGKSTPKYKKYLGQLIERVSASTPKITSSYSDNAYQNWSAFNGVSPTNMRQPDTNTCWLGQQNVYDDWIQYEFNRLYWFNKIKIKCFSNYSGDWTGNIKILGSQDGINWENILASGNNYELTAEYQSITTFDINLKDDKEYQYIRLQADNVCFSVFGYPSCFFDEIYVYGGVIASSELEDILTGVNNPSSDLGVNGQVYLKYADYNSLYDFKEYIEVGSTQGAYINTGLKFTTNSEFEIDCQWTDTPTNTNGYAFGAWTSNQDTFVGFQNGNTFNYAVGGVHNNTTGDFQRHVFKATQTKMYIDNVEQSRIPKWSFVSTAPIGIFIISNNTSYLTNNCKVYYIKMWDNDSLVHYFVPVERKSDNEAGMLDIITGIFYDNDGTQSFTVGGTSSFTFDYPITQAYSKINSTWQNLIGTDVRKIMSGQKYNYVVTGTFTTASIADTEVDVYCGFEPDIVYVEMEFSNGITKAIGYNGMNHSMWDLTPIEDRVYSVEIGTPGQTGISNFTSTGFKYNAHAGNTLNKNCTYCAIKLNPTAVDDYVTIKKVYMRVYPGQETTGDNLQFSDDGINWDVTVNYQQCNPRSNAVIVKDVLQVYYESPNWYIACASLFAKDENNNNYRMYDVMWSHHYNGIQPANFTGWIPNFLDE